MLGKAMTSGATVDQWAHETGLDWNVQDSPLYYRTGDTALQDDSRKVLYRSDAPEVVFGAVGKGFAPVQPAEILDFYSQLEQETGFAVKSGGILKQRRIFVIASNDRQVEVGGHPVKNLLVGATENGGTMGTRISPTNIRPICENTLQMALNEALRLSFTHRSPVDWKAVKKWVTQENETFDLYGELMRAFHAVPVNMEQTAEFAKEVLAPDWDGEGKEPRKLQQFAKSAGGQGQYEALNNGRPNAFWLLNAFTRYADHDMQARSEENRTDSAQFGPGNTLKNAVLQKLVDDCVHKWGHREVEKIERELVAVR